MFAVFICLVVGLPHNVARADVAESRLVFGRHVVCDRDGAAVSCNGQSLEGLPTIRPHTTHLSVKKISTHSVVNLV